jgi:hypothetical protein
VPFGKAFIHPTWLICFIQVFIPSLPDLLSGLLSMSDFHRGSEAYGYSELHAFFPIQSKMHGKFLGCLTRYSARDPGRYVYGYCLAFRLMVLS